MATAIVNGSKKMDEIVNAVTEKKEVPMSKPVKNSNAADAFCVSFLASIEPFLTALDDAPDGLFDDGKEARSQTDIGVRIELGQMLSFYHRQLNGPIKTASGGTIRSAKEMLEYNELELTKLEEELTDPSLSTTGMINIQKRLDKALYYFAVNEAKVVHYENMLSNLSTIYSHITGETWEPMAPKEEPSAYSKMTDDEKKAANEEYLAKIAAIRAKKAA